jgi:nicotinamide-nucleotide amidase
MTAEGVLDALRRRGWTIATAESCTGGMITAALTDIPGSSDVVDRGFVTYSNAAKVAMLGVRPATLEAHGAVSEAVAAEMAKGALERSDADVTVSVTGVAGPGGSAAKPEGRVCFGLASGGRVLTETREFGPIGRSGVRTASVRHALAMILSAAFERP